MADPDEIAGDDLIDAVDADTEAQLTHALANFAGATRECLFIVPSFIDANYRNARRPVMPQGIVATQSIPYSNGNCFMLCARVTPAQLVALSATPGVVLLSEMGAQPNSAAATAMATKLAAHGLTAATLGATLAEIARASLVQDAFGGSFSGPIRLGGITL
jgi:hypothetical protein